jgi:hypothetical protein
MAKPKLSLTLKPTFTAKVPIPIPGSGVEPVEFIFKARTRMQFAEFVDALKDRPDVDVILDIASGWELEDAFGKEMVEKLCDSYMGAARAIIETYLQELTQARLGN